MAAYPRTSGGWLSALVGVALPACGGVFVNRDGDGWEDNVDAFPNDPTRY